MYVTEVQNTNYNKKRKRKSHKHMSTGTPQNKMYISEIYNYKTKKTHKHTSIKTAREYAEWYLRKQASFCFYVRFTVTEICSVSHQKHTILTVRGTSVDSHATFSIHLIQHLLFTPLATVCTRAENEDFSQPVFSPSEIAGPGPMKPATHKVSASFKF